MTDDELLGKADEKKGAFIRRKRVMSDFRYDEQQEKYWDTTTGNLLAAKSVDGAICLDDWPTDGEGKLRSPSTAINSVDTGLTVEGSTWWPGKSRFIEDIVVSERGAMPLAGAICYNSYIGPLRQPAPAGVTADMWINHVKKLYPDPIEHEHFFDFCAHMIQRPDEKVNHGIVLAGSQGIGKDTALLPVRRGVGEWNAAEVGPDAITSQYNGHVKSVLLVINEVRPQDEEFKASNFYNLLKPILAAPPEMLPMTVKYANTIYVRNLCHVILTTNDPLTMYIPPEDRRLFVMSSPLDDPKRSGDFSPDYFEDMYGYLYAGGIDAVVSWLEKREFDAKNLRAAPPVSRGKKAIIESANQVRRTQVDEIFERFCDEIHHGRPRVFFQRDLIAFASGSDFFDDTARVIAALNAKNFHFKMAERGYDMIRNPEASEWRAGKFRSRMGFADKKIPQDEQVVELMAALRDRAKA